MKCFEEQVILSKRLSRFKLTNNKYATMYSRVIVCMDQVELGKYKKTGSKCSE